jgi:pyruvate dehydrogenase E2 component (dihydrolipoyllysine-residue acetyltransferase)
MEVRLPALAENVNSGVVVKILISEGDQIEKDQEMLELETEKAVAVVPAPEAGKVVKIHVKEGDEIKVGQSILSLSAAEAGEKPEAKRIELKKAEPSGEKVEEAKEKEPQAEKAEEPEEKEREENGQREKVEETEGRSKDALAEAGFGPPAPPSIRKLARQLGIDLTRVRGSERGGRIVLDDLKTYIEQLQRIAFDSQPGSKKVELPDFAQWGYVRRQPMSQLRKKISEAMTASWTTVPHVTQFAEADVSSLMEWLKKYGQQYEKRGVRLTLTGLLIKALIPVLEKYPIFNSSLDESAGEIIFKDYYHFGIAVDTEQGLIVPVIRDVNKKDLLQLSKELEDLAERTRQRKVSLEELRGGTFTISNQGGIGGTYFTPIIHTPEVAILGVGRAAARPVISDNKVEPRTLLPLALSYDHRAIDGADAARFIHDLVEALENFAEAELKLPSEAKGKAASEEQKKDSKSTGSKARRASK